MYTYEIWVDLLYTGTQIPILYKNFTLKCVTIILLFNNIRYNIVMYFVIFWKEKKFACKHTLTGTYIIQTSDWKRSPSNSGRVEVVVLPACTTVKAPTPRQHDRPWDPRHRTGGGSSLWHVHRSWRICSYTIYWGYLLDHIVIHRDFVGILFLWIRG